MFVPIRCKTCGRVVAQLWEEVKERRAKGEDIKKILDELDVKSYCCRALLMSHIDVIEEVSKFKR